MNVPKLLCGFETWTLNSREKLRIAATEIKVLRSVLGVSFRAHISHTIRMEMRVDRTTMTIKNNRQKWISHVDRIEDCEDYLG